MIRKRNPVYEDLRRQKELAIKTLPENWVTGGVGIAVDGAPFLTIRVAPGFRARAIQRLKHARLKGPYEVIEMKNPGARAANPAIPREPIAPYRYPVLAAPIPEQQLVTELSDLLAQAGVTDDSTASIWLWDPLDVEHAKNPRRYAQVIPAEQRFEFARATLQLPYCNRLALLAHEVGHVIDPEGGEDDADAAAQRVLGVRIGYDKRWPGKGMQVALNCPAT